MPAITGVTTDTWNDAPLRRDATEGEQTAS